MGKISSDSIVTHTATAEFNLKNITIAAVEVAGGAAAAIIAASATDSLIVAKEINQYTKIGLATNIHSTAVTSSLYLENDSINLSVGTHINAIVKDKKRAWIR